MRGDAEEAPTGGKGKLGSYWLPLIERQTQTGPEGLRRYEMAKCYKPHKQHAARKRQQASEMKARMVGLWAPSLKGRMSVKRYSVADIAARFIAARTDMVHGTAKDNLGHEVLPGERAALKGLQFQGLIEPEAWEELDLGALVPASSEDFSVSLPELRRGEMLLVFSNEDGDLRALAYK
jgi:hypothetical protein